MTVEEILAALQAIIDEAGDSALTEEQLAEVEGLEAQLNAMQRSDAVRARIRAMHTVRGGVTPVVLGEMPTEEQAAFNRYLRGDQGALDRYRNAQSEGTPSEGGFLVPPTFRDVLIECMHSFGGLATVADSITTTTGAPLMWPTVSDAPGGVPNEAVITPEGAAQASGGADLVFGEDQLGAYTYTTTGQNNDPLRLSRELIQDSAIDVEALVGRKFGERIARRQARDFATGSGVGAPTGILTTTADVELVTSNDINNAANGYEKLLEVEDALDTYYLSNARWVMSRATWTAIRKIKDADGRPLIQANAQAGIGDGIAKTLLGYPVTVDEGFPAAADDRNFLAFGDMREAYVVRHVKDVEILVDPYTRGKYRQVEMTGWARADATIQNRCAYVVLKGKDA